MAGPEVVRIELPGGGQVEVESVEKAKELYPDATVVHQMTWDENGNPVYTYPEGEKKAATKTEAPKPPPPSPPPPPAEK